MLIRFTVLSSLLLVMLANTFDVSAQPPARTGNEKVVPPPQARETEAISITGCYDSRLAGLDELMTHFVVERKLPGAALAVARNGRLVYARGFGLADVEQQQPVLPDSLFRIASISKPITTVAILQLFEQGRLRLGDKVFPLLAVEPNPATDSHADPRLQEITVLNLLQHTGGWDREKSFDAMFRSVKIAETLGVPAPAMPCHIIQFMSGQPLDFNPGERFAYSNFGYSLLGRVIERVTGETYDGYVRRCVLAPAGACRMRLGFTHAGCRADGEVKYYEANAPTGKSVFAADLEDEVPVQYGAWCLEAMDAHGGWIASAVDLVRFASAIDRKGGTRLLRAETIDRMLQRPDGAAGSEPDGLPKSTYCGCGWFVRPTADGKLNSWHTGSLDGTSTLLVRRHDGLTWAVLFNTRDNTRKEPPARAIDPLLHQAADAVREWPDHDLFNRFE